jgi:TolA-binding protein
MNTHIPTVKSKPALEGNSMDKKIIHILLVGLFALITTICFAEEESLYKVRVNVCSLIDSGRYADAASATDKLVADFSGNTGLPESLYWIAERYERYDKFDETKRLYQQVVQNYSNNEWVNKSSLGIARANIKSLIVAGKYDSAKTAIEGFIAEYKSNPDLPEALFWITERFQRLDRLEDAKIYYQRIIRDFPDNAWAKSSALCLSRINIASLLVSQEIDLAGTAIDKFAADFKDDPDLPEALFWIAERLQRLDRFEEAKRNFQRVIDNYPSSSWAGKANFWLSRVTIISLIVSQDFDRAKSALDKFMADYAGDSDYPETLYWIAERYERLGRFDEANIIYTQLSQKFTSNIWTDKAKLGVSRANVMALIVSEKYDQAKDVLNKLVADFSGNPRLPATLYWITERYRRQNRFEEADRIYQQIVDNYPDNPYAERAQLDVKTTDIQILLMADDVNRATLLINKFIADFKDDSRLHEAIYQIGEKYFDSAFNYQKEGFDEQAKEYYRKALAIWEKIATQLPFSAVYTPQAYYAVANCFSYLGDYNSAINYHKKVIADYPDFKNRYMAMFMLADCYDKQASSGEMPQDKAMEQMCNIYREILVRFPDCKLAGQVHRQLQDMCEQ